MNISINYDGGISSLCEKLTGSIEEIISAGGECVKDSAVSLCPVDTGTLRNSISVSVNGSNAEISANTDYAAYVEFGTSKMAPKPYLVPALLENADSIISAMAEAIAK